MLQPFLPKAKEGKNVFYLVLQNIFVYFLATEETASKVPPPYYNLRDSSLDNNKTVRDGAILSSEGYSYVSEVPSLASSQAKHSNLSKKTDYYQPVDNQLEPGYENSRVRRTHRKITHNEKRYHSGK